MSIESVGSVAPAAATPPPSATTGPRPVVSREAHQALSRLPESAPPEPRAEPPEALTQAVSKIQKFVEPLSSDLEFSVDEGSGVRVVRVIDRETKELIRQIPSQEALTIAAALDKLQGMLIRQKA